MGWRRCQKRTLGGKQVSRGTLSIQCQEGPCRMPQGLPLPQSSLVAPTLPLLPSFLCLSQESSGRVSTRRETLMFAVISVHHQMTGNILNSGSASSLFFKSPFGLQTQAGWIPVTSTGMTEGGVAPLPKENVGREAGFGIRDTLCPSSARTDHAACPSHSALSCGTTLPLLRHSCACHRNQRPRVYAARDSDVCGHLGASSDDRKYLNSGSASSLFFKSPFGLQTQAGWIPVISTGMTEVGVAPAASSIRAPGTTAAGAGILRHEPVNAYLPAWIIPSAAARPAAPAPSCGWSRQSPDCCSTTSGNRRRRATAAIPRLLR
ncbi:hypothetical protein EV281_1031077 [Rhizobium sp. BK418]|nr:hypothetical protein EV281_1031077 [Rhizobium sp. BK418]